MKCFWYRLDALQMDKLQYKIFERQFWSDINRAVKLPEFDVLNITYSESTFSPLGGKYNCILLYTSKVISIRRIQLGKVDLLVIVD